MSINLVSTVCYKSNGIMIGSSSEMLHAATMTGIEAFVAPTALTATQKRILSTGSVATAMTPIPHSFIEGLQTRQLVLTGPALEGHGAIQRNWGLVVTGIVYIFETKATLKWKLLR